MAKFGLLISISGRLIRLYERADTRADTGADMDFKPFNWLDSRACAHRILLSEMADDSASGHVESTMSIPDPPNLPPENILQVSETKRFVEDMKNQNTVRKTASDCRLLYKWLADHGNELRWIHAIPAVDLDLLMARFFLSVRKTDGNEYEPDTLKSFQSSFARTLSEAGYEHDIHKSPAFKHSRDVLAAKRKQLKGKGLGNRKNRADPFTKDELNLLWDKGILGAGTYNIEYRIAMS